MRRGRRWAQLLTLPGFFGVLAVRGRNGENDVRVEGDMEKNGEKNGEKCESLRGSAIG